MIKKHFTLVYQSLFSNIQLHVIISSKSFKMQHNYVKFCSNSAWFILTELKHKLNLNKLRNMNDSNNILFFKKIYI